MGLVHPLHARVPLAALPALLPELAAAGVPPEITLDVDGVRALGAGLAAPLGKALAAAGLRPSVHGPFGDVDPGSPDAGRRESARALLRETVAAVAPLRPRVVVFHPGLPPDPTPAFTAGHVARAAGTWAALLPLPPGLEDAWIAIENIYDRDPDALRALLGALPSPPFGACFDGGHARMFSPLPLERWFEALGPWIREAHLHDNHGGADEHLPPGRGTVDFRRLLRLIGSLGQPVVGTLELGSLEEYREGVDALAALGAR